MTPMCGPCFVIQNVQTETPHFNVRNPFPEIETIYRAYQVLLLST